MGVVGSWSVAWRQAGSGKRRQANVARDLAGYLAEIACPTPGTALVQARDSLDALTVVSDFDPCTLSFARIAVSDAIYPAHRCVNIRGQTSVEAEHVGLAAAGSGCNAELWNVFVGARGLAFVSCFEVIAIATAAAPGELLAETGRGVVEPPRDCGVAGPYHGGGETDVVDHAALARTTLLVAVATDQHTISGLLLRPVDADLVGLAFLCVALVDRHTLALLTDESWCAVDQSTGVVSTHAFKRDVDVDTTRLAGVDVGSTVGAADRLEEADTRATTRHGNTNVFVALVTRKAVARGAAVHRLIARASVSHIAILLGRLLDRIGLTVRAAYEALKTTNVATRTAPSDAQCQGACKPKTLHFDSP